MRLRVIVIAVVGSMMWAGAIAQTPASFSLRISPEQQTAKVGDPVTIDVIYTNNLDHDTMIVRDDYPEERYFVDVRDDHGARQKLTNIYAIHARSIGKEPRNTLPEKDDGTVYFEADFGHDGPSRPIKSGESIEEVIHLNRLYILGKQGIYSVQLKAEDMYKKDKSEVSSNVVHIRITN